MSLREHWLFIAMLVLAPAIYYSQRAAGVRRAAARREFTDREQALNAEAFQRRRRLTFWGGYLPMVSSFVLLAVSIRFRTGLAGPTVLLIFFGLFCAGLATMLIAMRCPVCGGLPMVSTGGLNRSMSLDPEECEDCGARLK